jgi:hypothetical protein
VVRIMGSGLTPTLLVILLLAGGVSGITKEKRDSSLRSEGQAGTPVIPVVRIRGSGLTPTLLVILLLLRP